MAPFRVFNMMPTEILVIKNAFLNLNLNFFFLCLLLSCVVRFGFVIGDFLMSVRIVSNSAPSSPVQFKSPGTALMSLGRYVLDEPDDEPQIVRNLNLNPAPAAVSRPVITMKATRVLSRPSQNPQQVQQPHHQAQSIHHGAVRSAPARRPVANPPAPILEHTRRGVTIPIGASGGSLPRFMQTTAAARQRTQSGSKEEVKPQARTTVRNTAPVPQQTLQRTVAPQQYKQPVQAKAKEPAHHQQQENQSNRYQVTIPETPQWLRNSRTRGKPRVMSTEEKELAEVEEKKRKLAEIAKVDCLAFLDFEDTFLKSFKSATVRDWE